MRERERVGEQEGERGGQTADERRGEGDGGGGRERERRGDNRRRWGGWGGRLEIL